MSQRDERFENLGDAVSAHANKLGRDLLCSGGGSLRRQGIADGLELLRQLLWPGLTPHLSGGCDHELALHRRRGDPSLELGAQPADLAAPFFLRALAIEGNQVAEEIIITEVGGPAIRGKDGAVEIVVQTPEHADEAAIVNVMVRRNQRRAGAKFHQHVIECRQGQIWMQPQALLPQCIQFLGDGRDRRALALGAVRKREWVKAARLVVPRVVTDSLSPTRRDSPVNMRSA